MRVNGLTLTTEEIIDKYADMVYRVALSATKSREDAEDIFQEVFLRLVRFRDKLKSEEHAKAWLLRVTINCAKKLQGSAWHRKVEYWEEKENIPDSLAEKAYERVENEDSSLSGVIAALPEHYRLCVYLFYYEELSIEQIGMLLGEKESTIKSRLHRARELLRRKLEGEKQ